ncbi:MAG: hypothetical protein QOI00_1292 [Chloroflexota bacterium]|jgi:hypothetical protein|nr:hypothetical protein [Chloroflexota bacterium]
MDLIILAVFVSVLLLGIAALFSGVDSRPGFVDPRLVDRPNRAI